MDFFFSFIAIGALKTLELLDVSFNYLEKLPEEIGCLQKLKRLYAFSNRLKQLPKCIWFTDFTIASCCNFYSKHFAHDIYMYF